MEEWASLESLGFPGYSISNMGEVRRDQTGRTLKLSANQYGVVRVGLMRREDARQITMSVPRLVAIMFVQGRSVTFDTPINLNGNREDNRAENIVWRPRHFAVKFTHQFETLPEPLFTSKIYDVETTKQYENSREVATENGLLEEDIMKSVVNGSPCFPTWQIFARVSH